jgi:very-short-patch-repair endonuclease
VPGTRRVRLPDALVHQSDLGHERMTRRGVPVTSVSRTLVDLAALPAIPAGHLAAAVDRALLQRWTSIPKLLALTAVRPGRGVSGAPALRSLLRSRGYLDLPDASALERHMHRLLTDVCRAHRLPAPVAEHPVCGGRYRLDFAWPALRLAVEVDGYAWHASAEAMARDRRRRSELAATGWTVLVFTWQQVHHERGEVTGIVVATYRRLQGAEGTKC